jgi:cephalosporin hydroxylase
MLALAKGLHTDKGTDHSYLTGYEVLFRDHRIKAENVLEIGIDKGGSLELWKDYFCCATIHGIDIKPFKSNDPRIWSYCCDAYTRPPALPMMDIIIDDGSHKKEDMLSALRLYLPMLKDDGIFVIEDIPDPDWIWELREAVPKEYMVDVYDWRLNKNRFDDILFVVRKINVPVSSMQGSSSSWVGTLESVVDLENEL